MSQAPSSMNPAQAYEDYFVPGMFRDWSGELLRRAQPGPGERILDIACGSGIVARLVAHDLDGQARVTGLDLSPAMIDVARRTSAKEGVEIEWHVGNAGALPFANASFDLVLIQQGLQFFPDRAAAAREVYRILTPGGRVATATWTEISNNPFNLGFAEVIERHFGAPAMHTPFSFGNQDVLRAVLAGAGFAEVDMTTIRRHVRFASPDRFVELGIAAVSAAVPALQSIDTDQRARLVAAVQGDMAPLVKRYTEGDELVFPMEANIAVARKAE